MIDFEEMQRNIYCMMVEIKKINEVLAKTNTVEADRWLNTAEAAKVAGVSTKTMKQRVKLGIYKETPKGFKYSELIK
jgi:hypothetical protein